MSYVINDIRFTSKISRTNNKQDTDTLKFGQLCLTLKKGMKIKAEMCHMKTYITLHTLHTLVSYPKNVEPTRKMFFLTKTKRPQRLDAIKYKVEKCF